MGQPITTNLLRTLECVTRHMSFARAAEELCVSPSAVSQQIQKLEEQLGTEFFRRVSNKLIMTEACVACLEPLRKGLGHLAQIPSIVQRMQRSETLRLSVAPSFAARWLVPRLEQFSQQHERIELWVNVTDDLVDFSHGEIDLAIRYGKGRYPNLHTELLLNEVVFPVCSPSLLPDGAPLAPRDLLKFNLLHDDSAESDASCPDWRTWFETAGVDDFDACRGLHFNQSYLVLDAALAGRGVALAKGALARNDIAAGRLIQLFDPVPVQCAYYLVCPAAHVDLPAVRAWRNWIFTEMEKTRTSLRLGQPLRADKMVPTHGRRASEAVPAQARVRRGSKAERNGVH